MIDIIPYDFFFEYRIKSLPRFVIFVENYFFIFYRFNAIFVERQFAEQWVIKKPWSIHVEINSVQRWTRSIDVAASFRGYLHNITIYREVITWCILVTFSSLLCYEFCLDDLHGISYKSSHIYLDRYIKMDVKEKNIIDKQS